MTWRETISTRSSVILALCSTFLLSSRTKSASAIEIILFTDNHSPGRTSVYWIVPPYAFREVFPPADLRRKSGLDREDLQVLPNATLLCKELIPYFQDNAFSVDINDNYRIIIFHSQFEMFLRAHFHSSLRANLFDGDIGEEYDLETIQNMMSQLGVGGDNDDDEMVPLSDLQWHTVLGQAILEEVMRDTVAEAS
ncbi:hypothetical protein EV421DRAFT_1925553 [Armillaria borealis]|uniref:HNH nuclease domain-containing protein n=1 Tax=Armillaria borealis TaxID=47425 RepID=A0AA39MEC8_9AGAR|nr:hypothetical protein EV421DRAFT_1925553 [Armillaria borealis]